MTGYGQEDWLIYQLDWISNEGRVYYMPFKLFVQFQVLVKSELSRGKPAPYGVGRTLTTCPRAYLKSKPQWLTPARASRDHRCRRLF